ncbi:MAG TPA: hypothetical protein PK593_01110 [Thermomicrobiales bacterium]|nr:hypothetical protein [Thermomicrobiales bacterium]
MRGSLLATEPGGHVHTLLDAQRLADAYSPGRSGHPRLACQMAVDDYRHQTARQQINDRHRSVAVDWLLDPEWRQVGLAFDLALGDTASAAADFGADVVHLPVGKGVEQRREYLDINDTAGREGVADPALQQLGVHLDERAIGNARHADDPGAGDEPLGYHRRDPFGRLGNDCRHGGCRPVDIAKALDDRELLSWRKSHPGQVHLLRLLGRFEDQQLCCARHHLDCRRGDQTVGPE